MTFPEAVRAGRAVKKMSQEQLANTVKVTRQTIHCIEQGKTVPNLTLAKKIATALGISLDSVTL